MKFIYLLFILHISVSAWAEQPVKVNRKKTSEKSAVSEKMTEIKVRTVFGDKVVSFLIQNRDGKSSIEMSSNSGVSQRRDLTDRSFQYIVSEFRKLPKAPKIPVGCERARMDVLVKGLSTQELHKESCFGVKTITSPKYARFAEALTAAFY